MNRLPFLVFKEWEAVHIGDCSGHQQLESKEWSLWARRPAVFLTRNGCAGTTSCSRLGCRVTPRGTLSNLGDIGGGFK